MVRVTGQRLANKTIVIVGGTSGLGLSAAQVCIASGATVVVVGRDASKAAALLEQSGPRVRVVEGDASVSTTAETAVHEAVNAYGRLDGLYHVAGGSGRSQGDGPLGQVTDEGWSATIRWNLDSVFYSNRAAVNRFQEQGTGGVVLNMSSVLGFSPAPRFFATHAYAAAKAAILGLTKAAAAFYAPHNIRFNALAPALVDTPMSQRAVRDEQISEYIRRKQPLDGGRVGLPTDLDNAVVYFLSDESRFVTGQILAVDGGWCVSDATGA